MVLPETTAGKVNEYRIHRLEECRAARGKPPAHNTMHQEIVTLRQIFKTALRHGWIDHLPDLSEPYRSSPKISHRAGFSPEEYKQLYEATRNCALDPKQPRFRWEAEQLHHYVLFSVNIGLRPDEAMRLQLCDVTVVEDEDSGQTILEIEVGGKRGVGCCKSTAGAVRPFERLKTRTRSEGGPGEDRAAVSRPWPMGSGTSRVLPIFCFRNGHAIYLTQFLKRKSFGPTATAGRERPTACVIPTFACACSKVPIYIRLRRTAGQAWR